MQDKEINRNDIIDAMVQVETSIENAQIAFDSLKESAKNQKWLEFESHLIELKRCLNREINWAIFLLTKDEIQQKN